MTAIQKFARRLGNPPKILMLGITILLLVTIPIIGVIIAYALAETV